MVSLGKRLLSVFDPMPTTPFSLCGRPISVRPICCGLLPIKRPHRGIPRAGPTKRPSRETLEGRQLPNLLRFLPHLVHHADSRRRSASVSGWRRLATTAYVGTEGHTSLPYGPHTTCEGVGAVRLLGSTPMSKLCCADTPTTRREPRPAPYRTPESSRIQRGFSRLFLTAAPRVGRPIFPPFSILPALTILNQRTCQSCHRTFLVSS